MGFEIHRVSKGDAIDYTPGGADEIPAGTLVAYGGIVGFVPVAIPVDAMGAIEPLGGKGNILKARKAEVSFSAGEGVYYDPGVYAVGQTDSLGAAADEGTTTGMFLGWAIGQNGEFEGEVAAPTDEWVYFYSGNPPYAS